MEKQPLRAAVFHQDKRAGVLIKTEKGYEFIYDSAYLNDPDARSISLSMPLRSEKYVSPRLFSYFDGLLPEGWLLELTCAAAKIDKDDKFRLLLHTGRDPLGAVSLRPHEGEDQ